MKLYKEDDVKRVMAYAYLRGVERNPDYVPIEESILKETTPIELPNDEQIAKYMASKWFADNMHRECFKLGAIWMKTQIFNQNK